MSEPRLTRRAAAGGAAAAAGAGLLARRPAAAGSSRAGLSAVSASSFVDSVGVQTHLSYADTPYADLARVSQALVDLGIRHIRDDLVLGHPGLYAALNHLAGLGIGSDLITGSPGDAGAAAYAGVVATQLSGVESVEGTNEWDIRGGASWAQVVFQRQAELVAAMRSDPRTAGVRVLGPALAYLADMPQLAAAGPLGSVTDVANAHAYGGGKPMPGVIGGVRAVMAGAQPGQPVMLTETGYHNALNGAVGHPAVPEDVAAPYVLRLFLDAFAGGIERTFVYELLDEHLDPGLIDNEAHFGLLRHDLTPKPAYLALRTLMRLAEDARSGAARPLAADVRGPADLRRLVLQKRDGTHLLVLWRDVVLFERQRNRRVRPLPVRVDLRRTSPVRVYRPVVSAVPLATSRGGRLVVPLGGDVVVLAVGDSRRDQRRAIDPDPPRGVRSRRVRDGLRVSWHRPAYRTAVSWEVRVGQRSVTVPGDRSAVVVRGSGDVRVRALGAGRASAYVGAAGPG